MTRHATLGRLSCALLLVFGLAACGGDTTGTADPAGGDTHATHANEGGHDDSAPGPHGGAIAIVGDHVAHLEALHDEDAGQVTIYVLGDGGAAVTLDQPPMLNLTTNEGSVQVKAVNVGDAWLFEDDALLGEPTKARFRVVIGGKTYQPDMPCSHGHESESESGHEHGEDDADSEGHADDDDDAEGHDDDAEGHDDDADGHDDD